jgi:hypothetical protein
MLRSALRIVTGYAAACLAAGATQVLFVVDPTGLFATRESTAAAGLLTAMAATQAATFALPFTAIAVLLTEWFRLRGWLTFVLAGGLVALSGYLTVIAGEGGGLTLRNDYAVRAFLVSGAVAGFVYWMLAGRGAGHLFPRDSRAF